MYEIVDVEHFDFEWFKNLKTQKRKKGNPATKRGVKYLDLVTSFDIETTRLNDIDQSIMYVWQWCFGNYQVVVGRTWEEFLYFCNGLVNVLKDRSLWVGVHNLSYEFQFISGIYDFSIDDVFAVESRKILNATMFNGAIELHCTYLHSNMSLSEWSNKLQVEHSKRSGQEFGYNKKRYPWTPLTRKEIEYCVFDVIAVVECIYKEMEIDGDNLYTLPQTSTGYVRRDCKQALRNGGNVARYQLPDYQIYCMLREAFRGGNTHANRYYTNKIVRNVSSADRSSSYPDVICNCKFPVTRFIYEGSMTNEELNRIIARGRKAFLARIVIRNLRLKNEFWGFPYLSKDKCKPNIKNAIYDNGRVLSADYLETTVTDIDMYIISKEYDGDIEAIEVATANYGYLPKQLIDTTIKYYRLKTELKDVAGQEVLYMKSKNKLNAIYGMMVQAPVKQNVLYKNEIDGIFKVACEDETELLEKFNKKAFLAYQWGVWVTAWARLRLEEGLELAGEDGVYCDTDSVKYCGDIDWNKYNNKRVSDSKKSGAFATDPHGTTHFMGVFEPEKGYSEFVTLGAKKYCYRYKDPETLKYIENGEKKKRKGNPLHLTVSGVSKKINEKTGVSFAAEELEKYGGIEQFKKGFIFKDAGGTESKYNDFPEITEIEIDGHKLKITRNVVIKESTYTVSLTTEYEALVQEAAEILKKSQYIIDKLQKESII